MPDTVPTLVGESVLVEPDAVRILDRRVFPFERSWVTCRGVEDVAKAIEDMVTQSLGPPFAAAGGMVLAARAAGSLDVVAEAAGCHPADQQRHPGRRRRAARGGDGGRGRRCAARLRRGGGGRRPGRAV